MEAMYAVFAVAFLCCLGLLAPVLSVGRVALLTLINLLRRLVDLIGGSR